MEFPGRVAVVTGGASGIGAALCRRFAAEGARIVVADRNATGAEATERAIVDAGGEAIAVATDVSVPAQVAELVDRTEAGLGPIDLFCSNAGVARTGGTDAGDEAWATSWAVNVMAHVYAARAVLPGMLARREGYLLQTASAAGLLTNLGAAPYSVTKHAAVALAEWLAITYGDRGVKVSCLCPQGVATPMLLGDLERDVPAARSVQALGSVLAPEDVADAVVEGIRAERFLILPHPEVAEYVRRKGDDEERWLRGMRRLQAALDLRAE